MKAFLQILKFELGLHLRSPLFWILGLLLFALHFIAQSRDNINVGTIRNLININSPYQIMLTSVTFAYLGMLPMLVFIVNAMTRDHQRQTAEFFFVAPISPRSFLLGRFSGGFLLAATLALFGQLGSAVAELMPWLDPERLAPVSLLPHITALFALTLPFVFVAGALFFAVACLTRSQALTFAMALVFLVLVVSMPSLYMNRDTPDWMILLDPSGNVPLAAETRFWTVTELNQNIPGRLLPGNRLLWIALGIIALTITLRFFRFEVTKECVSLPSLSGISRWPLIRHFHQHKEVLPAVEHGGGTRIDLCWRGQLAQLASQFRLDIGYILRNPLFYIVLVIGVFLTRSEVLRLAGDQGLIHFPVTSLMLNFFGYGYSPYLLMLLIFFAGELVHRDRETRTNEIIATCPYADWIMPMAKLLALWVTITLLLLAFMFTFMTLQAAAGYTRFEPALYLQTIFIYSAPWFYMTCVLALFVHSLSPNKWVGMVILIAFLSCRSALARLGWENLLYRFEAPSFGHSDMDGFGPYRARAYTLLAYWGVFCILLTLLSKTLFARGVYQAFKEHLVDARSRFTTSTAVAAALALLAFAGLGHRIYYNTHVLNEYLTTPATARLNADYEKLYGHYNNHPAPAFQDIAMTVDFFPAERRMTSSAEAVLVNAGDEPIDEFVFSINRELDVVALDVHTGEVKIADRQQGFYLIALNPPLLPNQRIIASWQVAASARGFRNAKPAVALVENGSYLESEELLFLPGYLKSRELTNNPQRKRLGLPAIETRLPLLGDADYLDVIDAGISARTNMRMVLSTSLDQIAVTAGVLQREWQQHGRRYFDYRVEQPVYPSVPFVSARYQVARTTWKANNNKAAPAAPSELEVEIYYDSGHAYNIATMLDTARQALDYYSAEFGPNPVPYFRILEIPRFRRGGAESFHGAVAYSESAGFVTDMAAMGNLDLVTLHELAHGWWGGRAYGAYMQGRKMLTETLAHYSMLMMYKQHGDPNLLRTVLTNQLDGYLSARREETQRELPLLLTEDQSYVAYNKGALVMFALQDLIGADKVHQALRNFLQEFDGRPPPFPTSRDLVHELRAVAGDEYQDFITDQFEKIVFYDVQVTNATAVKKAEGYLVTIDYTARQLEADGVGNEQEVALNTWFDVVIFPDADETMAEQSLLHKQKHRLQTGTHSLRIEVDELPDHVAIDPLHLMIDRTPDNNSHGILLQDESVIR